MSERSEASERTRLWPNISGACGTQACVVGMVRFMKPCVCGNLTAIVNLLLPLLNDEQREVVPVLYRLAAVVVWQGV